MKVDIVITTYNRRHIVTPAIETALSALEELEGRLIIVDDASKDETVEYISHAFGEYIAAGLIELVPLYVNQGVTGAKNAGYNHSQADWVLILDSDDQLIVPKTKNMKDTLAQSAKHPIVFFRCEDETGRFVGQAFRKDKQLSLNDYIAHASYGESLPVLNRNLVGADPFERDLRGHEGFSLTRLIKLHGPALLSTITCRVYNRNDVTSLSTRKATFLRSRQIAEGYYRFLRMFHKDMTFAQCLKFIIKFVVYRIHACIFRT